MSNTEPGLVGPSIFDISTSQEFISWCKSGKIQSSLRISKVKTETSQYTMCTRPIHLRECGCGTQWAIPSKVDLCLTGIVIVAEHGPGIQDYAALAASHNHEILEVPDAVPLIALCCECENEKMKMEMDKAEEKLKSAVTVIPDRTTQTQG